MGTGSGPGVGTGSPGGVIGGMVIIGQDTTVRVGPITPLGSIRPAGSETTCFTSRGPASLASGSSGELAAAGVLDGQDVAEHEPHR